MTIGSLLFALTSITYILTPRFWPFLIVRVFQGIGYAFFHTASYTLIANISSDAHLGQSLSYFTQSFTVSSALAPPLGIFLINHYSFTLMFWIYLGLSLCSLFTTLKLGKRQVVPLRNDSTEDRFFLNWKAIPPSIVNSLSFFTWGSLTTFFPLYAINHGVANPGFFFSIVAMMLI